MEGVGNCSSIVATTQPHEVSEDVQGKEDQSSTRRIGRKERAEARRGLRGHKMGASSSKWKELSLKVEKIQNSQSQTTNTEKEDLSSRKTEEAIQRKSGSRRSKWAGLKGGMDFITRTKAKTAESKKKK
jgi:hypothetical protein